MPDPVLNPAPGQGSLFCHCGGALGRRARACRRCRQKAIDFGRRSGGWREAVLDRDHHCCVACGSRPRRPHVHHRRPGVQERRWLATLCARCHARIHKLAALDRVCLPPRLVELWSEQHPGTPVQLQLLWEAA